jgi:hypothetical protein
VELVSHEAVALYSHSVAHCCLCFCRHYQTQIAAYDIRTKRCDTYGNGDDYTQQCFLVYDGLHYDALAVAAFDGAPEEVDCTLVGVDDADLPQVRWLLQMLCFEIKNFPLSTAITWCDEVLYDVLALAAPEGALGDADGTVVGVGYADL